MKNDYTHITVILDRSGSMQSIRDDTIGGFNAFLNQQKAVPGKATLTLVQFDSQDSYEIIHSFAPIKDVPELSAETFVPRAMTPLLDALGQGINDMEKSIADMSEDSRPNRVVMVVITDGQENCSREFRKGVIQKMIKQKQDMDNWQFVFLSADLNAVNDALDSGIRAASVMGFDKDARGTANAWSSASARISEFRSGHSQFIAFTKKDRVKHKTGKP